jgi:hypothetical protein
MSTLKAAALALVLTASSAAAVAQEFELIQTTKTFAIGVDTKSLTIEMSPSGFPVAFMDVKIVLAGTEKSSGGKPVKSFVNTLAIDCFNRHTILVVGRAFSESGELVDVTSSPTVISKPYGVGSPTAIMVALTCPLIFDAFKPKSEPKKKVPSAGITI